jgi:hypothetical protein
MQAQTGKTQLTGLAQEPADDGGELAQQVLRHKELVVQLEPFASGAGVGGTPHVPPFKQTRPEEQLLGVTVQGSPGPARQHGPLGHTAVLALHSPLVQSDDTEQGRPGGTPRIVFSKLIVFRASRPNPGGDSAISWKLPSWAPSWN